MHWGGFEMQGQASRGPDAGATVGCQDAGATVGCQDAGATVGCQDAGATVGCQDAGARMKGLVRERER